MVLNKSKPTIALFGCGWLGKPLAQLLLENGFLVKVSTTTPEKLNRVKVNGIEPYLLKLESLDDTIFPFLEAEILIINIPSKNVSGFKNLISFIEKSTIKKVLFVSATSVYKDQNLVISEAMTSCFSESPLLEIEQLFQQNPHFKTTVLRFGGLFGYHRKPGNFFPSGTNIKQAEAPVNMIHRDDCIEIIHQIILQNKWQKTYNACADSHPTKRKFYTKANEIAGNPPPHFMEDEIISFKIISNEKLKKELNYTFKFADILKALEH